MLDTGYKTLESTAMFTNISLEWITVMLTHICLVQIAMFNPYMPCIDCYVNPYLPGVDCYVELIYALRRLLC